MTTFLEQPKDGTHTNKKLTIHKRGPNKQQHNKNMLRYDREIKPGLVTLYDIRPRNAVGLFLEPGAHMLNLTS